MTPYEHGYRTTLEKLGWVNPIMAAIENAPPPPANIPGEKLMELYRKARYKAALKGGAIGAGAALLGLGGYGLYKALSD